MEKPREIIINWWIFLETHPENRLKSSRMGLQIQRCEAFKLARMAYDKLQVRFAGLVWMTGVSTMSPWSITMILLSIAIISN